MIPPLLTAASLSLWPQTPVFITLVALIAVLVVGAGMTLRRL